MTTTKTPVSALALAALLALACASPKEAVRPPSPAAAAPAGPPPTPETPDAAFRASKPPPLPTQPHFEAPVPAETRLANGVRLLVVENHAVPLVSLEVLVGTGVDAEPPG